MLKSRLFAAQIAVMVLIALAAATAYWQLQQQVAAFDHAVSKNFEAMGMLNDSRVISTNLESLYLPTLVRGENPEADAKIPLHDYREAFRNNLNRLETLAHDEQFGQEARAAVAGLGAAVTAYVEQFDSFFSVTSEITSGEDRIAMRTGILRAGVAMAERSDDLLRLLNASAVAQKDEAMRKAQRGIHFLVALLLAPLLLAGIVYYVIDRNVIDPIIELTRSIRGVQQQNFEAVLPVRFRNEIGDLGTAFNDMSAELRVMKMATDREMLRLSSEGRAIVSGFPYPVFILEENGEVVRTNPAADEVMSGLSTWPELPTKLAKLVAGCIGKNEDYLAENVNEALLFRCNEVERWYLPGMFRIRDDVDDVGLTAGTEHPPFQGWAVVLIDVTRVRWLDEMKNDMIGTVSHEIKTPLTSIRIILHLLAEQKGGELNPAQARMVGSALDDCERLLATLENLLQLSRLESGQPLLDLAPVEPSELVEDARESFASVAAEKGVTLSLDIAEHLLRVNADRIRVGQVFSNLISNAIKHAPEGSEIVVSAVQADSDAVRFEILDRGQGIEESEQDRIFERFYRSPGQNGVGTGLGLSICREIVHAHGGRIGVDSDPGKYTKFYFELTTSGG